MQNNVFESPTAYLDPRHLPPVPLIQLPPELNPFPSKDRVKIYAQAAFEWPLQSLKHPAVFHMFHEAEMRGELDGVHTITDSSSGNTAKCEAIFAQHRGLKAVLFVPADMPKTKEDRLRELADIGADLELVKCRDLPGEATAMQQACLRGQEKGCRYIGQYSNPDNIKGHLIYHITPAWEQTREKMTVYAGTLGTCGHIGAAISFTAPITVVAGYCAEGNPVPGMRTMSRLSQVPLSKIIGDTSNANVNLVEIRQAEAYRSSWELAIAGIHGGPTSGGARVALEKFLKNERRTPGAWERLRNKDGNIVAVFMCGDAFELYSIEKYRQALEAHEVPKR
ncbi:MAG: pyridoxal-phosphate dependent enzyme [Patescibacteria group bacterium]|nr:pyridoxal-phosphate dependent enzyme [Patescibacteria group bacterium]